jgi:hypothetical protein
MVTDITTVTEGLTYADLINLKNILWSHSLQASTNEQSSVAKVAGELAIKVTILINEMEQ